MTEKSYEDPRTGLSVWSGLLFDRAIRDGAADADRDGKVSVQEAVHWAGPHAAEYTKAAAAARPPAPGPPGRQRLPAPRRTAHPGLSP